MTGELKALYIDDVTIGMINSDPGFVGEGGFHSRNERFSLPGFATIVGVALDPRAYDAISGMREDVAEAVIVVINDSFYKAERCTNRTYFRCDGETYSLPLSRVDVGKLLMGERPHVRPTQEMLAPFFHSTAK